MVEEREVEGPIHLPVDLVERCCSSAAEEDRNEDRAWAVEEGKNRTILLRLGCRTQSVEVYRSDEEEAKSDDVVEMRSPKKDHAR